jgi:isochorismate hydrolase
LKRVFIGTDTLPKDDGKTTTLPRHVFLRHSKQEYFVNFLQQQRLKAVPKLLAAEIISFSHPNPDRKVGFSHDIGVVYFFYFL